MGPPIPLNIAGQSYAYDALEIECQRCVNFYAEAVESGQGRAKAALIGVPGLSLYLALASDGPIRGNFLASNGSTYVVAGSRLFRLNAGASTDLGALPGATSKTSPVSMADNGSALVLVDGTAKGWYLLFPTNVQTGGAQTTTNSPQAITDAAFTGSDRVASIDGYFLFNRTGTGQFYVGGTTTDTTNKTTVTFDALDFATAEANPDALASLADLHRVLWLFGTRSTEFWADTGDADFPFAPIQGAALDIGCAAPQSIAKLADCLFWLGQNSDGGIVVYRGTQGYQAQRVSTTPIEQSILAGRFDDAVGLAWQEQGHLFYGLRLPTTGRFWVFDQTTALWHERAALDADTGQLVPPRFATAITVTGGTTLFGDASGPTLYRSDAGSAKDVDRPMPYIRILPHLFGKGESRIRVDRLQLDVQTGTAGTPGDTGTAPQVRMAWSQDGGYTYGNEHAASLGHAGQRALRVMWRRLGMARDRVVRFSFTGIVRPRIAAGWADVTAMRH